MSNRPVAKQRRTDLQYIHQDHLGGTTVTSSSSGAVEASIKYLPFGGTRSGSVPIEIKFTGQRLDDTGLYYYGARYYDAGIGRFVSADPTVSSMSNPQALNRYAYVINNPLKYTDPTGLFYVQNVGGIPLQDCDQDGACVTVSDPGGYEGAPVSNPCLSDPLCGIDVTPPAASSGGDRSGHWESYVDSGFLGASAGTEWVYEGSKGNASLFDVDITFGVTGASARIETVQTQGRLNDSGSARINANGPGGLVGVSFFPIKGRPSGPANSPTFGLEGHLAQVGGTYKGVGLYGNVGIGFSAKVEDQRLEVTITGLKASIRIPTWVPFFGKKK